jgi:hypothetical protein
MNRAGLILRITQNFVIVGDNLLQLKITSVTRYLGNPRHSQTGFPIQEIFLFLIAPLAAYAVLFWAFVSIIVS